MELAEELVRLVDRIAAKQIVLISGQVKSVDKELNTIIISREGEEDIEDVRLGAVSESNTYIRTIPKVGSVVAVGAIDGIGEYILIAISELEKLEIKNENLELSVSAGKVEISSGETNLLALIMDLIGFVKKIIVVQGTGPDLAGYLNGYYGDKEYIEALPTTFIPKQYDKGNFVVFEIDGESMNDNSHQAIKHSDRILCKQLDNNDVLNNNLSIKKYYYILVTQEDGIVCKQILKNDVENKILKLHSLNPNYKDYEVKHQDVKQIFQVYKIIERQLTI